MKYFWLTVALLFATPVFAQTPPTYYQFDDSGFYKGTRLGQEDPLSPGTYFGHGNQETDVAPPAAQAGYLRQWTGIGWTQVRDWRGETVWKKDTGQQRTVPDTPKYIGASLPPEWTDQPPPDPEFSKWNYATNAWEIDTEEQQEMADLIGQHTDYATDSDNQLMKQKLRKLPPAELETFIRGFINADGCTDLASCQLTIKRLETAVVRIAKYLASQ